VWEHEKYQDGRSTPKFPSEGEEGKPGATKKKSLKGGAGGANDHRRKGPNIVASKGKEAPRTMVKRQRGGGDAISVKKKGTRAKGGKEHSSRKPPGKKEEQGPVAREEGDP